MAKQNIFQLPVFIIKEVRPLLSKNDLVFAYEISGAIEYGNTFKIYENKGLDLSDYIDEKMECLLEITRGQFHYKDQNGKKPKNVPAFQYQWLRRPYEFFPELMKLREDSSDDEKGLKKFDETAGKFFTDWGLNGVGMEVYQAKPLLKAPFGIFLLNEFEFEEEIDNMTLNEEIYINIEEMYLRGIRPLNSIEKKRKPKQEKEEPIKSEEKEPKKLKFTFKLT